MGEYFEIDSTIFRILIIFLTIISFGLGIFGYLTMWAVISRKPKEKRYGNSGGTELNNLIKYCAPEL